MKRGLPLLLFLLALLLAAPAEAAEGSGGYLLQVKTQDASLFSLVPPGIEALVPELGLYRADTLEDAAFFTADEIQCLEPDHVVELFEDQGTEATAWNLELLGTQTAARAGLDGSGVRVGVVDSGLYAEHEALAGACILKGWNYIGKDADTSDSVGHGTFVTGIITAAAPGAEVVPLKCFSKRTGRMGDIIAAIYGGVDDYGCDILNLSFGLSDDSQLLREAIQYAAGKGTVLVAAVGNNGTTEIKYPAGYSEVIGVGMVAADKTASALSQRNASVMLTAPGAGLTGPDITGPSAYRTGGGTSYACPHVAAAAALLMQAAPGMTAEEVCVAMVGGAEDLGEPGYDETYGYGLLSVAAMLEALPPLPVQTDAGIELRVVRPLAEDETAQVWAASYSAAGRMLACCPLPASVKDGVLAASGLLPQPAETEWVRLFFLQDGVFIPVLEAEQVQIPQSKPPAKPGALTISAPFPRFPA